MKRVINIDTWKRKEHYCFFKEFADPFFGLTVNVDFTAVYKHIKEDNSSFFLHSLHKIMEAANAVEEFRYRIENDQLVCYDVMHAAPTVGRWDGTFSFSFFEYNSDVDIFVQNAKQAIDKVNNSSGLGLDEDYRADVLYYSSVPWIQFTDMKHATSFGNNGAIPRISTGKCFHEEQKVMLPVSITVNHAVMDGLHISHFLDKLHDCIRAYKI